VKNFAASAARLPLKLSVAVASALLLLAGLSAEARAQNGHRKGDGRIEVSTTPGGYPIRVTDAQGRQVPLESDTTSPTVQQINLTPGTYNVEILFPNSTPFVRTVTVLPNKRNCITLAYRPKTVTVERAVKSPCPYPVNISAPPAVREGDLVTFAADADYAGQSGLNYTWTISPPTARITQGAGTPTITVDTTGMGTQRLTAILVVDDGSGDRMCRQRTSFMTAVNAPPPPQNPTRRFAEFPSIAFNEDKANFDNFASELQATPGAQGYIIVYQGRRSRPNRLTTLVNRSRDYMVNTRGVDANRIVVIAGGARESDTLELWVVPQGAEPPRPTPR
jgi:hypothetical protein